MKSIQSHLLLKLCIADFLCVIHELTHSQQDEKHNLHCMHIIMVSTNDKDRQAFIHKLVTTAAHQDYRHLNQYFSFSIR